MSKNQEPLITVIVPVYNVEKYVEKCALSLVNQTYRNLELIFVNDGSSDRSAEILSTIKDKRIKIIHQENNGVSTARNAGLDAAKGEYVVFVDSDDYVAEDYVKYLYELIKNNADFAYTTELFKSRNDTQSKNNNVEIVDGEKSSGILLSPDVVVGSYNKIYRRDVIEKNGLRFRPDLYYGEGLNFIIRMSLVSEKVVVGNRKILYYRKNNASSATTKYSNDKCCNGLKSLKIINRMINHENEFVDSMYRLHISNYYLGAIAQMIENGKTEKYKRNYDAWKKSLRSSVRYIVKSEYISNYRKCLVVAGAYFPHVVAMLDIVRRRNTVKRSV